MWRFGLKGVIDRFKDATNIAEVFESLFNFDSNTFYGSSETDGLNEDEMQDDNDAENVATAQQTDDEDMYNGNSAQKTYNWNTKKENPSATSGYIL